MSSRFERGIYYQADGKGGGSEVKSNSPKDDTVERMDEAVKTAELAAVATVIKIAREQLNSKGS